MTTASKLFRSSHGYISPYFVVDVDGSVTDVNVLLGFHEAFDRIAVKAIKSLPKFKPATQYNRKIRYRYRQTVAFEQTEQ